MPVTAVFVSLTFSNLRSNKILLDFNIESQNVMVKMLQTYLLFDRRFENVNDPNTAVTCLMSIDGTDCPVVEAR
jgi:hypothetical protein